MTTPTNPTTAPASANSAHDAGAENFPNDRRKRNIPVATDRRRAEKQ
jgi:hypothetical protein